MSVDPTIFREYDIRGLVDESLTEEAVERIGRAYATLAAKASIQKVAIGRDCREHSPRLAKALAKGLMASGVDVLELGVVTTPMLYFSLFELGLGGGIMITGSHNPPEYNGLKICLGKSTIHGAQIQEIRRIIESEDFPSVEVEGKSETIDIVEAYEGFCSKNIQLGPRKLKVVIDAGNGTAGPFAASILKRMGIETTALFCDMDPSFPNHHPDPTVETNLEDLKRAVLETGADVGLAFDGDADRVGAVNEKGEVLWGDEMMIVYAQAVLKEVPGGTIIGEVKCSQTLYDEIERLGGKAVMWKAGHSLIKDKMKQTGAVLAGEMSGHIFFKHRFFGFDDGIYAGLRFLEILSKTERPLSSLLADIPETFSTPEIRVDCPESIKFALVDELIAHFKKKHEVIDIDGARVTFADGWGLIRASNTQPLLVLRFEAKSEARLGEIRAYIEGEMAMIRREIELKSGGR